jgi:hypothetical protein
MSNSSRRMVSEHSDAERFTSSAQFAASSPARTSVAGGVLGCAFTVPQPCLYGQFSATRFKNYLLTGKLTHVAAPFAGASA